ncbi:reverse transcriptase domain-containing protein [Tanacetum coccineum]
MVSTMTSLIGFSRETIWPLGQLRLLVTIGDVDHSTRAWMNFMIVRSMSPYNGIIGRSGIREIQAVPSTAHGMLKFPVDGGIVTIYSTILIPAECATVIISSKEIPKEAGVRHENFKVAIHPNLPDQEVAIGETLSVEGRTGLCTLLKENLDIFAWQPSNMTGVPRSVAKHRLNIRDRYSPVRQKKRGQAPDRAKTIQSEACPHDCYPLPEIDWKVESLCGYPFKYFLDAYKGYHQIQMAETDEEKTTFHTSQGPSWPEHREAVLQLPSPRTIKEVQSLNGKLASLNKSLSKSAEKSLLLFKALKKCIKKSEFHWTSEAEQAFKKLKQHFSELPLLVAPKPKEELIVYLSASYGAVSAVLMTERGTVQTPVYFISCALQGPELNYTPIEKLVLSLIISRPDVAGRLQKWSVMSGEHNITYRPRMSVKGQILADFLVEKPNDNTPDTSVVETPLEPWTLFTDGSSCVDGSGAGLILTSPEGTEFTYALHFQFTASNNEAEYEALIAGLRIAAQMGVRNVQVSVDSKFVANQVLGTYVTKEENMIKYPEKVKGLVSGFASFSISQVPRSKNKKADALSKIASTSFAHLSKQVLVKILKENSIHEEEVATGIDIAGPFPEGPGKAKFLIVAMDYFTKWIEAKAVATITGNQVKNFVWDNIVCHFGLPGEIVSDNGKQFSDNPFKDWCDKFNITQQFASMKHSQSNRLVERANRSLGEGIKARLGEGNKNWIEELPHVLWAHRTMIKLNHGDTPFSLTYGNGMPSYPAEKSECPLPQYRALEHEQNDEELIRLNLGIY